MSAPEPTHSLPSLDILQYELEQYRKTGRALHLAHAVRALGYVRMELQTLQAAGDEPGDLTPDNQETAA